MNRERITQGILLIGVIVIWVIAGQRVVDRSSRSGEAVQRVTRGHTFRSDTSAFTRQRLAFLYTKTYRNPFQLPPKPQALFQTNQPPRAVSPKRVLVTQVPYVLEGILFDRTIPLAILRDGMDRRHFVSAYDTLANFVVKRITADSVYFQNLDGARGSLALR